MENKILKPGTPVKTLRQFSDPYLSIIPDGAAGVVASSRTSLTDAHTEYLLVFENLGALYMQFGQEFVVDESRIPYVKDRVKVRDVKLLDVVDRSDRAGLVGSIVVDCISVQLGDLDQLTGFIEFEGYNPDGGGRHCFEVGELDDEVVVLRRRGV